MANALTTNYNTKKLLLGNNKYLQAGYVNDTYADIVLQPGLLVGRIATTDYISDCVSGNSDGTQFPLGVVVSETTIPAGELVQVQICNGGKVREDMIILDSGDSFTTDVSSINLGDRIEQIGINLIAVSDLTDFDNQ